VSVAPKQKGRHLIAPALLKNIPVVLQDLPRNSSASFY
jgi:hypothetical protein